jgi:hypothetical protein
MWVAGIELYAHGVSALINYVCLPAGSSLYQKALSSWVPGTAAAAYVATPTEYIVTCLVVAVWIAHGTRQLWNQVMLCPPVEVLDLGANIARNTVDLRLGFKYMAGFGLVRRALYTAPAMLLGTLHQLRRRDNVLRHACLYLLSEKFSNPLVLKYVADEKKLNAMRPLTQRRKFIEALERTDGSGATEVGDACAAWLVLEAMHLEFGYRCTAAHLGAYKNRIDRDRPRTKRISLEPPRELNLDCAGSQVRALAVDVSTDGLGVGIEVPVVPCSANFQQGAAVDLAIRSGRFAGTVVYCHRQAAVARIGLSILESGDGLLKLLR